jgi:uncharacterized integral membrane protein
MDFIAWIGRLLFFLLALYLALENTATVPLRLSSSIQWSNVPLLAVILVCFFLGVLAGSIALMPRIVRLRRQVAQPARTSAELAAQAVAEQVLTRAARQGGAAGDLELETRTRR